MNPAVFIKYIKINQMKLRNTTDTTRIIKISLLKMEYPLYHQITDFQKNKQADNNCDKNNSIKIIQLVVFNPVRDINISKKNSQNLRDRTDEVNNKIQRKVEDTSIMFFAIMAEHSQTPGQQKGHCGNQ